MLFRSEMDENGCSPDGCTYNTITQGLLQNKEVLRAIQLLQEMLARGFSADVSTTTLLVEMLCDDKLDQSVKQILSEFVQ